MTDRSPRNPKKNADQRERPLLMSGPMVRAILEGRKTQTRRVMKPQPNPIPLPGATTVMGGVYTSGWFEGQPVPAYVFEKCPYGQPGDRLWVRETWQRHPAPREHVVCYAATGCSPDCVSPGHLWRPSIFMPRTLCRLSLEITEVRVERLQEITKADAKAEGGFLGRCECPAMNRPARTPIDAAFQQTWCAEHGPEFHRLWDELNKSRGYGWDANPWVWVISFRQVTL